MHQLLHSASESLMHLFEEEIFRVIIIARKKREKRKSSLCGLEMWLK